MTILLLKGYNNYFNRIVKQETSISAYKSASTSYLEYTDVNFNPNDGIITELVVGGPTQKIVTVVGTEEVTKILDFEDAGSPDYLIVHDNTNIASKWFVLECVRIRSGQYKLALKRDVLADFYNDYIDSPCYVEKGFINDIHNPILYNPEGTLVNQIKKEETLLKDISQCAWLVGYMKKDATATVSGALTKDLSKYASASSLAFKDCIQYIDKNGANVGSPTKTCVTNSGPLMFYFRINDSGFAKNGRIKITASPNVGNFIYDGFSSSTYNLVTSNAIKSNRGDWQADVSYGNDVKEINSKFNSTDSQYAYFRESFNSMVTACSGELFAQYALVRTDNALQYDGQLIQYDNKLWRLHVEQLPQTVKYQTGFTFNNGSAGERAALAFFTNMSYCCSHISLNSSNPTQVKVSASYEAPNYVITAVETEAPETITATIPGSSNRRVTNDAMYDIFAIPYNPDPSTVVKFKYKGTTYKLDSEVSLLMANLLMTSLGMGEGGYGLDLQLLPYCPLTAISYPINCGSGTDKTFSVIEDGNHKAYSFICFPTTANFTKNITLQKSFKEKRTKGIYGEWHNVTANWNDDGILYMMDIPLTDVPLGSFNIRGPIEIHYGNTIIPCYPYGTTPEEEDSPIVAEWAYDFISLQTITFWIYTEQEYLGETLLVDVYAELQYDFYEDPTPLEMKVHNECDFMRLTSPNYNGMFEFKLSKLQDGIHYFNVDCTYKPVNPYIKLNPDFSFLYGQDFNDAVGLILGGDFSLPILTDPWNEYELANKNYQNIFNRQIQNLDINQRIQYEQANFQGIVGAITAPITGGIAGGIAGAKAGPYGAIAGAAVGVAAGGVLGGIGYAKDMEWLRQQQGETRSYTVDMYKYNLGTIQALPQSISKSSPLTYNNKVWPILEEFSCTDQEKEIIRNKIEYNGMNINAIGTIAEYSNSNELDKVFVKGQLIRLESIKDDFHIVDALYEEVNKGFYVKGD